MSRAIHRERPWRRQIGGLLASAVLLLLVIGMPVWLSSAGRPSLHVDVGSLWQAVEHHRPGDVHQVAAWLGQVAVLLAWIAWAWLTLCVVLEVVAWRTGRSTVRLPASRSVQCAAALLVGTAFAVGSLGRLPVHSEGTARSVPVVAWAPEDHLAPVVDAGGAATATTTRQAGPTGRLRDPAPGAEVSLSKVPDDIIEPAAPRSVTTASAAAERSHTVAGRESLWSIAEERLGTARRWRDIADLNYGRPQTDGSALREDHWLQPGWVLLLPEGATSPPPTEEVCEQVGEHHDEVRMQADPAPSVRTPSGAPAPAAAARAAVATTVPTMPGGIGGTPVQPLGAGIVGVGVADLVDRLRRVQQRHRAQGGQIRLPEPLLRPFEQRLRLGGGATELDAVEAAVLALTEASGGWPAACRLTGATVGDEQVRLTFDSQLPTGAPAPFGRTDDGLSLVVDRSALGAATTRRRADRDRFPAPTLVSVGRADGVLAMVDLEGLGAVVVAGDSVAAEGLGRAMALELATSRWGSAFDLVLVGFGAGLDRAVGVTVVGDAGPVIADLTWRRLTTSVRLDDALGASVDAARRHDSAGGWRPVVVVCAPVVPLDDVEAILGLASDGRLGICAVAMGGASGTPGSAGCVLRAGQSTDVLGTEVEPQVVDAGELEQAAQLLEIATQHDGDVEDPEGDGRSADQPARDGGANVPSRTVPYGRPTSGATSRLDLGSETVADPRTAQAGDGRSVATRPAYELVRPVHASGVEVEVAVLGPVEVRGAARGFTRAWALELVVYLALHPGGATNEVWATALWPDRLMAPSSLHSTASVARRSLGTARDGSDHLPRSHGRLALAPTVGTDWMRFQELASIDDPDGWEEALSFVRGRPFEGIRSTDWSLLDGTAPSIEAAVVDLSGRLAGARLRAGDTRAAEWAARKGLVVSPYDERLYRMLLRTADAAGNPGGVEAVMTELVRVVADEVEPVESVHPSTLALYRSLSRRTSSALRATSRR